MLETLETVGNAGELMKAGMSRCEKSVNRESDTRVSLPAPRKASGTRAPRSLSGCISPFFWDQFDKCTQSAVDRVGIRKVFSHVRR